MGASLRRRYGTDEERAIGVWTYVRETMYHYPMRNENHEDQFDAAKLINVYGYSFCTQQGVTAAAIARAAGLTARVIGVPGHGMYEVLYDGSWHAFCTTAGFYVRTRDPDVHIASMEELKADPTLATRAREENRAATPFLPCAIGPEILGEEAGSKEVPYALSYRHYDDSFFAKAAANWRDLGEANPSRYASWVKLRRGESLRLDWDASGAFLPPLIGERFHPPRHLCGAKDRANPFFEAIAPYERELAGKTAYRYYGSGEHRWKPLLSRDGRFDDLARAENLQAADGTIWSRDAARPAVAEFEMAGPYLYVGGALTGRTLVPRDASLKISLRGTDPRAAWTPLYTAPAGDHRFHFTLKDLVHPTRPVDEKARRSFTHYRFRVRVEMSGAARLSDLTIKAAVQHNWCALPRLAPGANKVEVRTRSAALPPGVSLELAWDEDGRFHSLRRGVTSSPERFEVEVGSHAVPRMRWVLLAREES